jgi:hypothetical protein
MAKYLINSTDIEFEEVSGTENLKLNLAPGNSVEQMIGDLSDLDTTDKSNVVNAINEINSEVQNKNLEYIVATISSAQTISSNYVVNLNSIARSQGNFTINNGAIVIGEGINHIRVSGSFFVENWVGSSYYLWGIIKKNDSRISGSITGSTSSYLSASIPMTIIDVQEGDLITLVADSGQGGTLRTGASNTWLCVEKID